MNVKVAINKLKGYNCRVQRKGKDLYIVDDCGYTEKELIDLAYSYENEGYTPKPEKPKSRNSTSKRKKKVNLTRDWEDYDDDDYGDW